MKLKPDLLGLERITVLINGSVHLELIIRSLDLYVAKP